MDSINNIVSAVPEAKNVSTYITNGNTQDIISAIIDTDLDFSHLTKDIAEEYKGETVIETCKNIYGFIRNHIEYKEDPPGVQYIKTASRLLKDKVADCKSFSLFCGSILKNLQIPFKYRFVSYSKDKELTHVYVIVCDEENKGIVLDSTYPKFQVEPYYTNCKDIMTKIYQLSGPSRTPGSFIGLDNEIPYFMKSTDLGNPAFLDLATFNIYMLKDYILTRISLLRTGKSKDDIEDLTKALGFTNDIIKILNSPVIDSEKRMMLQEIKNKYMGSKISAPFIDFSTIWQSIFKTQTQIITTTVDNTIEAVGEAATGVYQGSKVLVEKAIDAAKKPLLLAAKEILEIRLPKAAYFFVYCFVSDDEAEIYLTASGKTKRKKAIKVLDFISDTMGMDYEDMLVLIQNNIIKQTAVHPRALIFNRVKPTASVSGGYRIADGGASAVVAIIGAVIALITLLVDVFGKKNEQPSVSNSDAPNLGTDIRDSVGDLDNEEANTLLAVVNTIGQGAALADRLANTGNTDVQDGFHPLQGLQNLLKSTEVDIPFTDTSVTIPSWVKWVALGGAAYGVFTLVKKQIAGK